MASSSGSRPLPEALAIARQLDLDLVEVAPLANPPVCRIMDYGKFKFDAAQKAKESRRKTTSVGIKEMKYRPKIGPGDFDTKTRQVLKFLDEGHKVKVTIMFRGREVFHPELGQEDPRPGGRAGGRDGPGGVGTEARRSQHGDGAGAGQAGQAVGGGPGRVRTTTKGPAAAAGGGTGRRAAPERRAPGVVGEQRRIARRGDRQRPQGIAGGTGRPRKERDMPKMKTDRGAAKRFKITGTGRLRRRQANRSHLLEKKSTASGPVASGARSRWPPPTVARCGGCSVANATAGASPPPGSAAPGRGEARFRRRSRKELVMARVKRAINGKKHRRAVLEQAQGYYGNRSRSFRSANEAVMHSLQYAYRDRRARKGDFRRLWIQRINAAARANGISYSRLIAGLREAEVVVDRKVLADLAVTDPDAFARLVGVATAALADRRRRARRWRRRPGTRS